MTEMTAFNRVYSCPKCDGGDWRPYLMCPECGYDEGTPI